MYKGNKSYLYVADGNKNITQLINLTTGEIANKYDYSPFGQLAKTDENVTNPFKFSSEYAEKETGLIYYNYRYYNPSTGKWLKRDPIGEKGGTNLYVIVYNNIIAYVDSLGLEQVELEDDLPIGSCVDCHVNGAIPMLLPTLTGPGPYDKYFDYYQDMVDANTIGADKYFHCLAHCQLARDTSSAEAEIAGIVREIIDNITRAFRAAPNGVQTGLQAYLDELREQLLDSKEDYAANKAGIKCACNKDKSCKDCCTEYANSDDPNNPGNPVVPRGSMDRLKGLGY
ncbi:RHS repeat-associated core domain-containing protein [Lentisphaerota bacterium WC36G]|nr:hypothetical protein LJT99_02375 [Lentisphaerae bacterium WC36]